MVSAETIVQAQVEAYNARDIAQFTKYFAEGVEIFDFPDTLILKGKTALEARYRERFERSEDLQATILKRFSTQTHVVDIEDLSGSAFGSAPAAVIYEVQDNLIQKAWFVRDATI